MITLRMSLDTKPASLLERLTPFFLIALFGLFLSAMFLFGGGFIEGDSLYHMIWAQQFITSFKSGLFFPRWVAGANGGLGSAAFSFYQPFLFYTYVPISLFIKQVLPMLAVSAFFAMVFSGFSMYVFSRLFAGRAVSAFTAFIYMALPFHLLTVYSRTALAELWAFFWLPLVFYFIFRQGKSRSLFIPAGLALSVAGLVITHFPTALLTAPFIFGCAVYLAITKRSAAKGLQVIAAFLAGSALCGFFIVPAIMERNYIFTSVLTEQPWLDFRRNFLFTSHPAIPELISHYDLVGLAALIAPVLILGIWIMARLMRRTNRAGLEPGFVFAVCAFSSFFLATGASGFLWQWVPVLQKVQFPYRALTLLSFFSAASAGFFMEWTLPRARKVAPFIILIFVLPNAALAWQEIASYIPPQRTDFRPGMDLAAAMKNFYKYSQGIERWMEDAEFNPHWVETETFPAETVEKGFASAPALINDNDGKIDLLFNSPEKRIYRVRSPHGGDALLKLYYYPHWKAFIGAKCLETSPLPGLGFLAVRGLPPGNYDLVLEFEKGKWFWAGTAISLCALALIAASAFIGRTRNSSL